MNVPRVGNKIEEDATNDDVLKRIGIRESAHSNQKLGRIIKKEGLETYGAMKVRETAKRVIFLVNLCKWRRVQVLQKRGP